MKKIFFLLSLLIVSFFGFSQSKGYLRYDSLYIERIGGNGELILLNGTRNQKGFLYNTGNGRTIFKAGVETVNDSTFVIGNDTLHISANPGGLQIADSSIYTTRLWDQKGKDSLAALITASTYVNPMTTLGDIIKGGASGVQQRLAGNITAIPQTLRSTGTGSAATAPVWNDASLYTPNGELAGDQIAAVGNGRDFINVHTTATYADGIITGCVVSYVGGLTYRFNSPCVYNINGTQYSLPASSDVTLPDGTAGSGEFRTDAIVVTTSSTATSVTGDNSISGVGESAQPDPATQFLLSYVRIDEANTAPTGVGQTIVRDEGSGGEWTISKTLTSTDNYSTNPFHLTISQRITGANSGQYMQWVAPAVQSKALFTTFIFYIRNNSALANVRNLTVTLRNGNATQVGNAINITTYGYVKSALGSYQTIAIPMSAFQGGDAFDRIRITNTQVGGTVDFQIDYVQLQSGIVQPPSTGTNYIFSNGLTLSGNNVTWGGTLTERTYVYGRNMGLNAATAPYPVTIGDTTGFVLGGFLGNGANMVLKAVSSLELQAPGFTWQVPTKGHLAMDGNGNAGINMEFWDFNNYPYARFRIEDSSTFKQLAIRPIRSNVTGVIALYDTAIFYVPGFVKSSTTQVLGHDANGYLHWGTGSGGGIDTSAVSSIISDSLANLAIIDDATIQDKDLLRWDNASGTYKPYRTVFGNFNFKVGTTSGAPGNTDTHFINSNLIDKHFDIYKNGVLLDSSATGDYTFDNSTGDVTFDVALSTDDIIKVRFTDVNLNYWPAYEVPPPTWTELTFGTVTSLSAASNVWTSGTTAWGGHGLDAHTLTADGKYRIRYQASDGKPVIIGWNTSNADEGFAQYEYGVYIDASAGVYSIVGGSVGSFFGTLSVGDYAELERIGSTVYLKTSTDGTTWTTQHTFASTTSATLYYNLNVYETGKGYHPQWQ